MTKWMENPARHSPTRGSRRYQGMLRVRAIILPEESTLIGYPIPNGRAENKHTDDIIQTELVVSIYLGIHMDILLLSIKVVI